MEYPVDDIQRPAVHRMVSTYEKAPSADVDKFLNHGKPFLYRWDLLEGPWEPNKLHGWIINAMKQGIQAITTHVPTKVFFLGVLSYRIVIDFEDLHRLYSRQHLDVNLISIWCL
ncbi:hypothetical protein SETIT_1G184200v2 [Setaria italica]|uniref:Uncharacterized protein n=1 Tax=Setaria italica TaxID=4555 RepID=A0A368PNW8_SETIT|nr:hypothetical protein SETIT_1G184200v2 [Setaria italica]